MPNPPKVSDAIRVVCAKISHQPKIPGFASQYFQHSYQHGTLAQDPTAIDGFGPKNART